MKNQNTIIFIVILAVLFLVAYSCMGKTQNYHNQPYDIPPVTVASPSDYVIINGEEDPTDNWNMGAGVSSKQTNEWSLL